MISIYGLTDPRDGRIRYVGKTCWVLGRRLSRHIWDSKKKSTHKQCWIQGVLMRGDKPKMVLLEECTEEDWQEREKFWIASFPEEQLTNLTPGGEGVTEYMPEVLAKVSGENNCSAKLTEVQVSEIKEMILSCNHTSVEIAKQYGVHNKSIENIARGKSWKGVEPTISEEEWIDSKSASWRRYSLRSLGENSQLSKLTDNQVREIKSKILSCELAMGEIAEHYGVTSQAIQYIAKGKTWAHVGPMISEKEYAASKRATRTRLYRRRGWNT